MKKDILEVEIENLLEQQFDLHKGIAIQDVYKLFFQICYGTEHLVRDKKAFREAFFNEVSELKTQNLTNLCLPMIEPISEDKVRVNLIPYILEKKNVNKLCDVSIDDFIGVYRKNESLIEEYCIAFESLNKKKRWFPLGEVKEFFQVMLKSGFPPVHHSVSYQDILTKDLFSKPHYRVILSDRSLD